MSAGGADRSTPPPSLATCRQALDALVASGGMPGAVEIQALTALAPNDLDALLAGLAAAHAAAALPVLEALVAGPGGGVVRRAARRALYRLAQRGVRSDPPAPGRTDIERARERAIRAWTSGIDGSGSRALWILFEGAYGALRLCSLIVSDVQGILEVAGGEVTKKRLDRELSALRASQKLPWVQIEGGRAVGLVAEALARHQTQGTRVPAAFERWRPLFEGAPPAPAPALEAGEPALLEGAAALLERPELSGWFFEPERVQADAVDLLQARESRLVVSDQLKAEREEAILTRVVERELTPEARQLWARRLGEMALIFAATGRKDDAALARAAGSALLDVSREVRHHPFARALAARALAVAGEVALGRLTAAEASRRPQRGNDH
jgi:hypothetical protein